MNNESNTVPPPRRGWVMAAIIGCALVTIAMIVVALVLIDKPHFGWMVGGLFLMIISSGVIVGALMVLVATLMLPNRWNWRKVVLVVWALIGISSPFFGFLFLLPWSVMAVLSPAVIVALTSLYRASS